MYTREVGGDSISKQIAKLSEVRNRTDLIMLLDYTMTTSAHSLRKHQTLAPGMNLVKSFIIETNLDSPHNLTDIKRKTQLSMKETDDKGLCFIEMSRKNEKQKFAFILDSANKRFWIFHSLQKSDDVKRAMRHLVTASMSKLDSIWLSRTFLTSFTQGKPMSEFSAGFKSEMPDSFADTEFISGMSIRTWGTASRRALHALSSSELGYAVSLRAVKARFLAEIDGKEAYADERLTYNGLVSASGTSASLHMQALAEVIRNYEKNLSSVESGIKGANSIRDITPLRLTAPKGVRDVKQFVELLSANMHRLRIFGVPSKISTNHYKIPAVDLHNGDKLNIEISKDGITVFLWPDACGNTLLRLETNIQKYVDAHVVWRGMENESTG